MTVDELITDIGHHLQDPSHAVVNAIQIVGFINDAAHDAANEGWVLKMDDDESVTITSGTFEYAVPEDFVYIYELRDQSNFTDLNIIPVSYWKIENGVTPVIRFSRDLYDSTTGAGTLQIKGHKRPKQDYTDSDSIDAGMESFLRERALSYAARNVSKGSSGRAQTYVRMAETTWLRSESLMEDQQDLFRPLAYAQRVYGR